MTHRVLVIGAGRRVKECFLPAFRVLASDFELAGIHARRTGPLDETAAEWGIPSVHSIADFDMETVDTIVVSITKSSILEVLERLSPFSAGRTLVIDTPVLASIKHLYRLSLLQAYTRVIVTEDYMNFPQFEFIRQVVGQGLIGDLMHVSLIHSGWDYHGLALIRSFFGMAYAIRMKTVSIVGGGSVRQLEFRGGRTATMAGPYDPERGYVLLAGTEGVVSDHPVHAPNAHLLRRTYAGGVFDGFEIVGTEGQSRHYTPAFLTELLKIDLPNCSQFNFEKVLGLITVLRSQLVPNINRQYGYLEGLYDHVLTRVSRGSSRWWDPFAMIGTNLVSVPDRLLARGRPRAVA